MEYESLSCQTLNKHALVNHKRAEKAVGGSKIVFTSLSADAVFLDI